MTELDSWESRKDMEALAEAESTGEVQFIVDKLREDFEKEFHVFSGKDPYVAGFAYAIVFEMSATDNNSTLESIKSIISERIKHDRGVWPPSSLAITLRSAWTNTLLYHYRDHHRLNDSMTGYGNYPWKYWDENQRPIPTGEVSTTDTARDWVTFMRFMQDDNTRLGIEAREQFRYDAENRNVMTNKIKRSGALKLVMASLAHETGPNPSVVDLGCSGNHILKYLALNMPQKINVIMYADDLKNDNDKKPPKVLVNKQVDYLLNKHIELGPSVGNDIWPLADLGVKRWRKTNTLRGIELLNPLEEEIYDFLEKADVRDIEFAVGDTTTEYIPELDGRHFNFANLSVVLSQLSPEKRTHMIEVAKKLADYVVITDFAKADPAVPGGIVYAENFYDEDEKFPCRTFVINSKIPNALPEEAILFTDGRCNEACLSRTHNFNIFR